MWDYNHKMNSTNTNSHTWPCAACKWLIIGTWQITIHGHIRSTLWCGCVNRFLITNVYNSQTYLYPITANNLYGWTARYIHSLQQLSIYLLQYVHLQACDRSLLHQKNDIACPNNIPVTCLWYECFKQQSTVMPGSSGRVVHAGKEFMYLRVIGHALNYCCHEGGHIVTSFGFTC